MSLELLKQLREKTGAGMVDCQKALKEAGGDMGKAVEILRKKGIAKAAKRGERETSEGLVRPLTSEDGKSGVLVQVSAETDFVARNDKFKGYVDALAALALSAKPADLAALKALDMGGMTADETLQNLSGTIGEKMEIKDYARLETSGVIGEYSHLNGRIGALVAVDRPEAGGLARDLAMQVAAADPKYLSPEDVPQGLKDKETEIYREQMAGENKPAAILDKIIAGKLASWYQEACLLNQEYIKDDKKKVSEILGEAKVEGFYRFSL